MTENPFANLNYKVLIDEKKAVIIGLSGGVDSMVLFDLLNKEGYNLVIAHVNHKKRVESDDEQHALAQLATSSNHPFEVHVIDTPIDTAFQETARDIRLDFFKRCAEKYNTDQVVLAHHLDDRIETFLMRLIKGSPLQNLSGLNPLTHMDGIKLIRPFAALPKQAIIDYANTNNITYYEDRSNTDMHYTRNRYRQQILPLLYEENPNLQQNVASLLDTFRDLNTLLDEITKPLLDSWSDKVPIEAFKNLNPVIQEHFLRSLLNTFGPYDKAYSKNLIHRLLLDIRSAEGNLHVPLGNRLVFHKEYNMFFIALEKTRKPHAITVEKAGSYALDDGTTYIFSHDNIADSATNHLVLWYNDKVFPLYLRPRQAGDKILCSYGHKKIKDVFIEKKVSPSVRDTIILLTNDKEVLWIPFLKMSKQQDPLKNKIYIREVCPCSKKISKKS